MHPLVSPEGRQKLSQFYLEKLLHNTVPFWFPRCLDQLHGGYLHCVDRDGSLLDTDKSVWAQGRMSWMLLSLYLSIEARPEWLAWAETGLRFLAKHAFDSDGRMFFHVTREGQPIRKRRYAYSEAFAAIAFGLHYRATGDLSSRRHAESLFQLFVDWNFTPGKMPSKFTEVRPMIGIAPRMITLVTAQELRHAFGETEPWNPWIDRCIEEIQRWFVKPDKEVVMEQVAPNGDIQDHFDGRLLNPGHALEAAWFILREAEVRQHPEWLDMGCRMIDWMWRRGWDREYGGLYYFRDVDEKPVQEYWHAMKFWWPHDEAIIATLYAYLLTGEERYADWHEQVHTWSYRSFADSDHGEWFGYLHRDGSLSTSIKGNLWKSFFHHPRMEWMCWQLLRSHPNPTSASSVARF